MKQWHSWALVLLLAGAALADEIKVDQIVFTDVRVTNIVQGKLEYIAKGAKREIELERVSELTLSKYPAYSQAVAKISSDPQAAAELLRGLMDELKDEYLRPLFRLQLSRALDGAGDFEGALENYLAALEADSSPVFLRSAPAKLPSDQAGRDAAIKLVEKALKANPSAATQVLLKAMLKNLGAGADQPDAAGTDATPQPAEPTAEPTLARQSSVEALLRQEKYDQALVAINKLIGNPSTPGYQRILPDLYFQRGSIESKLKLHVQAASSYLRVAMQYAEHAAAPAAWEQAGLELIAAEKFAAAQQILNLALQRLDDAQARSRIQQLLDRLPQP